MGCKCGEKRSTSAAGPLEIFSTTMTGGYDALVTAFRGMRISTPTLSREIASGATVRMPKDEADSLISAGAPLRIVHVYVV